MSDDYACGSSRNKKRDKAKKKRENPYKTGGRFRSSAIEETKNASKKAVNVKKEKAKQAKRKK
jgi:hypothetical protein